MVTVRAVWRVALISVLLAANLSSDEQDKGRDGRLKRMEQTIGALAASSPAITAKPALTFASKPLLRYSDPTRGLTEANVLVDASVWRLGTAGRPTAIVTLEIYRSDAKSGVLAYEFLSLSDSKFSLTHQTEKAIAWDATGNALKLRTLPSSDTPVQTAAGRLTQMRQLARRFAVREILQGEPILCRLLPQPIDRYQSAENQLLDGAIFAFANGTNPETGLILECDSKSWSYGIIRLSSAEAHIELDGREVETYPFYGDYGRREGAYTSSSHPIELSQ